jgi:transketolase
MHTTISELEKKACKIRLNIVRMIGVGQKGHLGGSCSLAEIVAVLYFYKMKNDPKNPNWEERDRFLLSKGHAALVQYAALAELGIDQWEKAFELLETRKTVKVVLKPI